MIRLRIKRDVNLSQKEVATVIGGSQSNLAKWEKEKLHPPADMVIKLADFFGVSTDYLLGRTDELDDLILNKPILTKEENILITLYRNMNNEKKARLVAYGEGIISGNVRKS